MSILPDWRIRELARAGMIEPFEERLVRSAENASVISYGLSSFGYDLRCADEWKVFTNVMSAVVDPKAFDERSFVDIQANEIIIPPNSFALARSLEYMRIPDNVMVVALGKSTYARCFSGSTRVALADGTSPTFAEMSQRAAQGEVFFGYSLNAHGRIVVTLLESPRLIGQDRLLQIELDNGERIEATPDHEFITRDGRSVQAGTLTVGDSLMPLYRRSYRGYEMVFQPLTGHLYPTHRLADEWNLRSGIYEDLPGTHRHHLDHNRRNNNPWNLVRMEVGEHIRLHNARNFLPGEQGGEFDLEEHSLAIREALAELRQNDAWDRAYRAAQRVRASTLWHDERYAQARGRLLHKHLTRWTAEERSKQRERLQQAYQSPELRERTGQLSREAWSRASEARVARQREIARAVRLRPEITEESVRRALDETGSIRGAARLLDCDRSVFRRFRHVVHAFKGAAREVVNHRVVAVRELEGTHDVYCLSVPEAGNFALEAGVFVHNCGIVANVTPLEPGWEGHVTLEFSNTTPLPAKMYAFEGCVQLLFFEGERPEVTYRDRGGKYQGQQGVTLPKL